MAKMTMAEKLGQKVKPIAAAEEVPSAPAPEAEPDQTPAPVVVVAAPPKAQRRDGKLTAPASIDDVPLDVTASAAIAPSPKVKRSRSTRKPAAVSDEATVYVGMGVDLEPALGERLVAYRAATKKSFHHIILDAVEDTYPDLQDLVAKALGREDRPQPKVSLFERTKTPPPVYQEGKRERVTHTVRVTEGNRNMLDQIAEDSGAPSRNFMICVALDAFLPAI